MNIIFVQMLPRKFIEYNSDDSDADEKATSDNLINYMYDELINSNNMIDTINNNLLPHYFGKQEEIVIAATEVCKCTYIGLSEFEKYICCTCNRLQEYVNIMHECKCIDYDKQQCMIQILNNIKCNITIYINNGNITFNDIHNDIVYNVGVCLRYILYRDIELSNKLTTNVKYEIEHLLTLLDIYANIVNNYILSISKTKYI